ncbi:asp (abnormal spindle) homolog, microcephaly associated (Drosophila) [Seminavis robusta]|uniref:Asp (Abnormal spindle) homolog, microcephaly associated (Drosophila) n=1 Tax=Seminavis robusta TaxID=568900 RepID=A0A9N8HB52_9STRA|nr:asp (abnormal spindle) homolog, microcephaly associated (Drosophila) [Seminavis robusta]|eukprot:Sro348_g123200.1 asp (abnormal spindle) homolog, microcephaly associated (Drosophila) (1087) ;mRNA; r:21371-24631
MSRARFYFLGARNGVVHIQRLARGMLDRRSYEQVRIAVVLMQKAYRSRKSNLAFVQQRSALLAIHRCERNWIGLGRRKRLRNAAAAQIQKRWRSWTYLRARVFVKRKAIIVQSAIRAFLARRAADQRRKAVASIQACLRRYSLKRRQACREASASVIIQKAWSEWAKRRIRSATAIQKPVRIFLGRSLVRRNVIAAIVVQSAFRMWSQQRRLSASRQAALMIQRVTKGFSVRNRRRLVQGSIVLLESSIRGWLLRVKLRHEASAAVVVQSTWRTHSHRVRYQNIQRALVVLLRFGRHILLRNELHDQSSTDGRLHLENQILPRRIQSMFRGHRIRRDLRRRQVAAVALQCWWRACMEMKRKHQKEALFALVRLQNLWRSYDARRAYYYVIICALRIQSQVRGYMVRREGQLLVGKKAARLIQANVRRWLARNQVLCQFRCAMVLQSLVRRSSAIALADAMQKSIIKIQAFARRYLAACLTESRKRSLVIIQTWARCCLARALAYSRRKSATKIQSLAKRYSAVALADSRRRRIIQIQSWIRGLLAVEGAMTRQQAVATIQRNLKSWIVRLKLRLHIKKILVTARALVLFQSLARRQLVLKEIAVKQRSAIAIQSAWRGFDARSLVMGMIANDACILIQSWIRGYLAQRNGVLKKTKTIVPIQNMVRRYLAILLAEARKESVVAIQTWARKCLAVALADSRRKSVIQIQSLARKSLAVEAAMSRQQAVAIIQCNLKSMFVRLKLKLGLARVRATARAFVLFQSLARRHLVLKEIAVKQRSAIAIQSAWRGFDARSLVMGMIANDACILIQSWIRGYLVQRNGALKHSKLASLRIQKAVRCFFAKGLFLAMREAAIRIQCLARVLSAKAKVNTRRVAIATIHRNMCVMVTKLRLERGLSMLRARRESVKLIQSKFRQYLVSNEDILANRLQAVVTIQRVWRGFVGRAIFSLLQDEAKVLQSMVRMGMARKRFLRRRHAVGVIQKFVRSRLAIRELCRLAMHDRMRPLLADLSSHISRKEYEKASNAAEKEVRLLLGGDLPTLNSAGICLRRLVTHVAQFRFLLETEKEEQSAAFETFDHVKDHCALCS